MGDGNEEKIVEILLRDYGRTYAEELGLRIDRNRPAELFQLLYLSLLLSARISSKNAMEAAKALKAAGLTTPRKMAEASWQDRVNVITWHGYKRYDERTSTQLGEAADLLLKRYGGDLRRLREAAGFRTAEEKKRLQEFKGIGEVGADIFLREVQGAWKEAYPYADPRVARSAEKLGLDTRPDRLAALVPEQTFPRLVAALVRVDLARAHDGVIGEAGIPAAR